MTGQSETLAEYATDKADALQVIIDEMTRERKAICAALGCVDLPGVPLKFIGILRADLSKAAARHVELLRSWDNATITERQELDRMRRGWGPTTPTERMRRRDDVMAAKTALSIAMTALTLSEEEAEAADEETNRRLDEAYQRVEKQYADLIAILNQMDEPLPLPDIPDAELLACLKHAVHWHDQLSPADIARFEAAIAKAAA